MFWSISVGCPGKNIKTTGLKKIRSPSVMYECKKCSKWKGDQCDQEQKWGVWSKFSSCRGIHVCLCCITLKAFSGLRRVGKWENETPCSDTSRGGYGNQIFTVGVFQGALSDGVKIKVPHVHGQKSKIRPRVPKSRKKRSGYLTAFLATNRDETWHKYRLPYKVFKNRGEKFWWRH